MKEQVKKMLEELKGVGVHTSVVAKLTGVNYQKLYYAKNDHYAAFTDDEVKKIRSFYVKTLKN